MIYFKGYRTGLGTCYGATDDDGRGVVGMLRNGYTAEYIDNDKIIKDLVNLPIDELEPYHALAITCGDIVRGLSEYVEDVDTDDGDAACWIINEAARKVYFALQDWGDGVDPGRALLFNYAGPNVNIKYREGWKR